MTSSFIFYCLFYNISIPGVFRDSMFRKSPDPEHLNWGFCYFSFYKNQDWKTGSAFPAA